MSFITLKALAIYVYLLLLAINGERITSYSDLKDIDNKLSRCQNIELKEITIIKAQRLMFYKKLTSEQLTQCYLDRINAMDSVLNSVLEINPDALKIAKKLDSYLISTGKLIGPLHGVPILLKDNIGTSDLLNTTGGSVALLNSRPINDAKVVYKLRKSGAIILGKANLSELAGFLSLDAPEGWSARGNQTINPFGSKFSVLGSSSGSAVAVSSNLCLVALGTETCGSIIRPASAASTFGFKPTFDSISHMGLIPLSKSQDTIGPITRSIDDSLIVTRAIAQPKLRKMLDSIYQFSHDYPIYPLRSGLDIKGMRLGLVKNFFLNTTTSKELDVIEIIAKYLKSHGATFIKDLTMNSTVPGKIISAIFNTEFKHYIREYLRNDVVNLNRYKIANLTDIIHFNNKNNSSMKFGQAQLIESEAEGKPIDGVEYRENREFLTKNMRNYIDELLDQNNLDILIAPSTYTNRSNDDESSGHTTASLFSDTAGYPILTIPAGMYENGFPIGISLFCTAYCEINLFKVAKFISLKFPSLRSIPTFINHDY